MWETLFTEDCGREGVEIPMMVVCVLPFPRRRGNFAWIYGAFSQEFLQEPRAGCRNIIHIVCEASGHYHLRAPVLFPIFWRQLFQRPCVLVYNAFLVLVPRSSMLVCISCAPCPCEISCILFRCCRCGAFLSEWCRQLIVALPMRSGLGGVVVMHDVD